MNLRALTDMSFGDSATCQLNRFTVVMALTDHRGYTEKAIESWNRQDYPRQLVRLLLIHDGAVPEFETRLPLLLANQDRLICYPGLSELELYDKGIRLARTEWVFICEPHVEMDRNALREMDAYLIQSGLDGATSNCLGSPENSQSGRAEDHVFARDFDVKGAETHWDKIILRGSCIRKSVYLAAGGLESRFGHFCEPLLGARIYENGHRIGTARLVFSQHHGTSRFRRILHDQRRYGWNQAACCLSLDPVFEERYFALAGQFRHRTDIPLTTVLKLLRNAAHVRGGLGIAVSGSALVVDQLRRSCRWRFHGLWAKNRLSIPVLHACRPPGEVLKRLAVRFWRAAIDEGCANYALNWFRHAPLHSDSSIIEAYQLAAHNSVGFYDLEINGHGCFRWTCATAAVLLPLQPGRYRLTIHLVPVREFSEGEELVMIVGRRRAVWQVKDQRSVCMEAGLTEREVGGRATPMHLISTTFCPGEQGHVDDRHLGVAVSRIQITSL